MKSPSLVMFGTLVIGPFLPQSNVRLAAQQPNSAPPCGTTRVAAKVESSLPEDKQGPLLRVSTSAVTPPTVRLSSTFLLFIAPQPHPIVPPKCTITSPNPQIVTLTNQGPGVLHISSITISGPLRSGPFSETNTCGAGLGAGQSCKIAVKWGKTNAWPNNYSVWIKDNSARSPQRVRLAGVIGCPF